MSDTRAIISETDHRPWPLPADPWVMFQSWRNLLFAHWPVPANTLRPLVPAPLEIDEFDGTAWIGQTPFLLADLHPRFLPAMPGISTFPEMNLRTYVRFRGRGGIWFFTLEAANRVAVLGARTFFRLPYHFAEMGIDREGEAFIYRSRRLSDGAAFNSRYRPAGPAFVARPRSLEEFLVERYALFTVWRDGRLMRGDVHHLPWRLQPAEAEIERNTLPAAHGLALPDVPPLLHYADRMDTLIWLPKTA